MTRNTYFTSLCIKLTVTCKFYDFWCIYLKKKTHVFKTVGDGLVNLCIMIHTIINFRDSDFRAPDTLGLPECNRTLTWCFSLQLCTVDINGLQVNKRRWTGYYTVNLYVMLYWKSTASYLTIEPNSPMPLIFARCFLPVYFCWTMCNLLPRLFPRSKIRNLTFFRSRSPLLLILSTCKLSTSA